MRRTLLTAYRTAHAILRKRGLLKLAPVRAVRNLLRGFLMTSGVVDIDGHRLFLDRGDSLELLAGGYEAFKTDLVQQEIRRGDVVLDLGAHIGYYTVLLARLVGEEGRVYAFEPDPENFALLKKNVEFNHYRNVTLVQKAVSARTGTARLHVSEAGKDRQSTLELGDSREFIEVEVVSLDDYFAGHEGRVDFIKMDIEGAEANAIQGMQSLLSRNANLRILTEFWPYAMRKSGIAPEAFLRSLVSAGFEIHRVDERNSRLRSNVMDELLQLSASVGPHASTYLLCIRGDRPRREEMAPTG